MDNILARRYVIDFKVTTVISDRPVFGILKFYRCRGNRLSCTALDLSPKTAELLGFCNNCAGA